MSTLYSCLGYDIIGLKLHIILHFLKFHLSTCAFQGMKLERWHRLKLMEFSGVPGRWTDLGYRLPNLPEHLNGQRNGDAFHGIDLDEIQDECKRAICRVLIQFAGEVGQEITVPHGWSSLWSASWNVLGLGSGRATILQEDRLRRNGKVAEFLKSFLR